jgi:aspartate/methionine/tyrosine aminotransferase
MSDLARVAALVAEERLLAAAGGNSILPLTGAPKVALPAHVRAAAHEAVDRGEVRLPSRGLPRLREAIADAIRRQSGRELDPESEILITNGAMQALSVTLRALLRGAGEVLIPAPAFMFDGILSEAGVRARFVRGSEPPRWGWSVSALESAITRDTSAVILCNPENPTGYVPDTETVKAVSAIASERGLLLVADESYSRFVYAPARHSSFAAVADPKRSVLIGSMSKNYAMSSWRLGFIAADADLVRECLPVLEWDSIRCGYVGQAAAAAAVSGPQEWMDRVVASYRKNRDQASTMNLPGQKTPRPDGAAFLFVRFGDAQGLHRAGIPAVPGEAFKTPGYVRIPFGGPIEAIHELDHRLASAFLTVSI